MSGDTPNKTEPAIQQQIDDSYVSATYANFCRITGTPEEIILDFGLNPQPLVDPHTPIDITSRIVTSLYSAKRLLLTLHSAIQRYENAFGEIETDVQKRVIK
jgi:hypothetical protein